MSDASFLEQLKKLDKNSYKPLYAQLADIFQEHIRENHLSPNTLIPSETEVCRYYQIGRQTVRIAMQRLETEGIIKRIRGKGTFVAEPKFHEQLNAFQSIEFLMSKQGLEVTNQFLDSDVIQPTHHWLADLNLPSDGRVLRVRRIKKIKSEIFAYETRLIPLDIAELFSPEDLKSQPYIQLFSRSANTEVHRIFSRMRVSYLIERSARALQVRAGTPTLARESVFYNREDNPLMTGRINFLPDKIELHVDIRKSGEYEMNFPVI